MSEQEVERKMREVEACNHNFGEPKTFERGFFIWKWKIVTSKQHYRTCHKCGCILHVEDGDLFVELGDKYVTLGKLYQNIW